MKKTNLWAAFGLSIASLGLTTAPMHAATYAPNDLLVAFYATGGEGSTTSVVLDMGPAAQFTGASADVFVSSLGGDLANAFGPDWASRDDVFWGVFGTTGDSTWTLYAGRAQSVIGTQSVGYKRGSSDTQSQPGTRINDLGKAYTQTGLSTGLAVGVNPKASIQDASAANDFAEYQANAGFTSFKYFQGALANFAGGVEGSAVDLFEMTTQTGAVTDAGSYKGTFTVGSNGVVRFSTIPNPDPTPTPTPVVSATPDPTAAIQKQIDKVNKQIKAAKKIDDPAKKKKKLAALKKKLKKLKGQL